ncbi:DNA-binding transcriptional regulator [uncultured Megasphaera sp.]|uniref:helix-turn-helix domain-containing protein n=1 Tax=uncultured Megasphaera sp. TaxID=165188 RepID=UPI0025D95A75|nr:helix-turn-helix transcriptional regulator [uncultured Megasphaera sp.]
MSENRIKEARKKAGLTQADVFELIGVPIRTLTSYENGKRIPIPWVENLLVEKIMAIGAEREQRYKALADELGLPLEKVKKMKADILLDMVMKKRGDAK